jgi:hypothetical protein
MAVYIAIRKMNESDIVVTYSFGIGDDVTGCLEIDKATGQIRIVSQAPNDESSRLFSRAAQKLRQHWEKGEYPSTTCWAS